MSAFADPDPPVVACFLNAHINHRPGSPVSRQSQVSKKRSQGTAAADTINARMTITGRYTASAASRPRRTVGSAAKRAMTMLVSRRKLPVGGIHPLAVGFDRRRHRGEFRERNAACERAEGRWLGRTLEARDISERVPLVGR